MAISEYSIWLLLKSIYISYVERVERIRHISSVVPTPSQMDPSLTLAIAACTSPACRSCASTTARIPRAIWESSASAMT